MKFIIFLFSFANLLNEPFCLALEIGSIPETIVLSGDKGGLVSGNSSWSSDLYRGSVQVLFYVDPDEKDMNQPVADALKLQGFDQSQFKSTAVINMKASWKPNYLINNALQEKQKEFPNTLYVRDLNKMLVKKWGLQDDSYHIVAFDREGKVIHSQHGTFNKEDIAILIEKIKKLLDKAD